MGDHSEHTIALIGGGLANTSTLFEFLKIAKAATERPKVSIRIMDVREDFFGTGPAYNTNDAGLTLNSNFATAFKDTEIGRYFLRWLIQSKEYWLEYLKKLDDPSVNAWLKSNEYNISIDEYEPIYMLRSVVGLFLKDFLKMLIDRADELGIKVDLIEGKVNDLEPLEGKKYKCLFAEGKCRKVILSAEQGGKPSFEEISADSIIADKLVISSGLNKNKEFEKVEGKPSYYRTHTNNIAQIVRDVRDRYDGENKVDLILLGAKSSYIDVIRTLWHNGLADMVRVHVVSRSGRIPLVETEAQRVLARFRVVTPETTVFDVPQDYADAVKGMEIRAYEGEVRSGYVSYSEGKGFEVMTKDGPVIKGSVLVNVSGPSNNSEANGLIDNLAKRRLAPYTNLNEESVLFVTRRRELVSGAIYAAGALLQHVSVGGHKRMSPPSIVQTIVDSIQVADELARGITGLPPIERPSPPSQTSGPPKETLR